MNIQDIIPDREIIKLKDVDAGGLSYSEWRVETPIWSDQIETLLENGFMCFVSSKGEFYVSKPLNNSPEAISNNKQFWRDLSELIDTIK